MIFIDPFYSVKVFFSKEYNKKCKILNWRDLKKSILENLGWFWSPIYDHFGRLLQTVSANPVESSLLAELDFSSSQKSPPVLTPLILSYLIFSFLIFAYLIPSRLISFYLFLNRISYQFVIPYLTLFIFSFI